MSTHDDNGSGANDETQIALNIQHSVAVNIGEIQYQGRAQTIQDIINTVDQLATVGERIQTVTNVLEAIEVMKEQLDYVHQALWEYLEKKPDIKAGVAQDKLVVVEKGYKRWQEKLRRMKAALQNLKDAWSEAVVDDFRSRIVGLFDQLATTNFWQKASAAFYRVKVMKNRPVWEDFRQYINDASLDRIAPENSSKLGRRDGYRLTDHADITKAVDLAMKKRKHNSAKRLQDAGYNIGDDGWLYKKSGTTPELPPLRITELEEGEDDEDAIEPTLQIEGRAMTGYMLPEESKLQDKRDKLDVDEEVTDFDPTIEDESVELILSDTDDGLEYGAEIRSEDKAATEPGAVDIQPGVGYQPGPVSNKKRTRDEADFGSIASVSSNGRAGVSKKARGSGRKVSPKKAKSCGCSSSIPVSYYNAIRNLSIKDIAGQGRLVRRWDEYRDKGHHLCYRHKKELGGKIGLRTKGISSVNLDYRLFFFLQSVLKGVVDKLKRLETHQWFRHGARPDLAVDALGPYRFQHDTTKYDIGFDEAARTLLIKSLLTDDEHRAWREDGSVNVDGFAWFKDYQVGDLIDEEDIPNLRYFNQNTTLLEIILLETEMYLYHLRLQNGIDNKGWLRNSLFSIGQQLMRQSPFYFALYAALRPDRNTRLVSHPYYMKYQVAEDGSSTFFRHVDIDIERLVKDGRGLNQIQGTVSLDDEQEDDCTEILPGLHLNLNEWQEDLTKSAAYKPGALVHAITKDHWTPEMKKKYGIDWTPVPCKAGQIRITQPHLPHGAQRAVRTRRTMLPWFVAVDEDENLEVLESGNWQNISDARRDMMPGMNSPSGLGNRFGAIRYPFPASVAITGLGPISDSLVGRRKLNEPGVLLAKKKLLTGTDNERKTMFIEYEREASRRAFLCFLELVDLEKHYFADDPEKGPRSFFARREAGLDTSRDLGTAAELNKLNDPSSNDNEYDAGIYGDAEGESASKAADKAVKIVNQAEAEGDSRFKLRDVSKLSQEMQDMIRLLGMAEEERDLVQVNVPPVPTRNSIADALARSLRKLGIITEHDDEDLARVIQNSLETYDAEQKECEAHLRMPSSRVSRSSVTRKIDNSAEKGITTGRSDV